MHRTTARLATVASAIVATSLLAAGTASAGGYSADDERCKNAEGVVVVCTADKVLDLDDLDVDVLNILDGHHHR